VEIGMVEEYYLFVEAFKHKAKSGNYIAFG
jgi:hypothetical protein